MVRVKIIEEKCEIFETHLLQLKLALNDSKKIEFLAGISQDQQTLLKNHSALLEGIQNQLLQFVIHIVAINSQLISGQIKMPSHM